MKYKGILTFEEEKRLEKIKSIYTTVFIISVFTFAIRLLTFFPVKGVNEGAAPDFIKILFELLCSASAVFFPYFLYGKSHDRTFKNFFEKKEKTGAITVLSALCLSFLSLCLAFPIQKLFSFLESDGFIFIYRYPTAFQSLSGQICYLVFVPLVMAFSTEYALRYSVLGNIKSSSKGFSFLTVFILNVCLFPLWEDLPFTIISAAVLSWLYLKTESSLSTFVCSFSYRFVYALLKILSKNVETDGIFSILSVVGGILFLITLLVLLFVFKPSLGKNDEDAFSKKEGAKALFASSMVYMIIFVSLVEVFCFYVNKPEKEEGETEESVAVTKNVDTYSDEVFFTGML